MNLMCSFKMKIKDKQEGYRNIGWKYIFNRSSVDISGNFSQFVFHNMLYSERNYNIAISKQKYEKQLYTYFPIFYSDWGYSAMRKLNANVRVSIEICRGNFVAQRNAILDCKKKKNCNSHSIVNFLDKMQNMSNSFSINIFLFMPRVESTT